MRLGKNRERQAEGRIIAPWVPTRCSTQRGKGRIQFHASAHQRHITLERRQVKHLAEDVQSGRAGQSSLGLAEFLAGLLSARCWGRSPL